MISPFLAALVPGTHFYQIYTRNCCLVTYLLFACCVYFYFSVFQFTAAAGWIFSHLILISEPHSLALQQPSALIPTVTPMANSAFANSFSEAPEIPCYICRSAICLFGTSSQSGIHQCVKQKNPRLCMNSAIVVATKGNQVDHLAWVVLYIFLSQATPYTQLALEISQAWNSSFPTGNFSFYSL